jgi:hypothetical protein
MAKPAPQLEKQHRSFETVNRLDFVILHLAAESLVSEASIVSGALIVATSLREHMRKISGLNLFHHARKPPIGHIKMDLGVTQFGIFVIFDHACAS